MNNLFTNPSILSVGMLLSSLIVIGTSISIRADTESIRAGVQHFDQKIEEVEEADRSEIELILSAFESWESEVVEYERAISKKQVLSFCGSMAMMFFGFGIFHTSRQNRNRKAESGSRGR